MGLLFSKNDTLDFAILPSAKPDGPLGLGLPNDTSLNKVEQESLIPALATDHVRKEKCAEFWTTLSECSKKYYWASAVLCRNHFDQALACNRKYLLDTEFQKQMTQRYLELRSIYRTTGIEPKR